MNKYSKLLINSIKIIKYKPNYYNKINYFSTTINNQNNQCNSCESINNLN